MIKIRHIEGTKFEATNEKEIIIVDTTKYSPVEFFITGLANCTLYDVVDLAKRNNTPTKEAIIEVEFKRKETLPKIFTEFHFIYKISSSADNLTAKKWVLSSLETYCSTINTIRNTSKIYYTIIHNNETIAYKETILSGGDEFKFEELEDDGVGCSCCHV